MNTLMLHQEDGGFLLSTEQGLYQQAGVEREVKFIFMGLCKNILKSIAILAQTDFLNTF